jgi:protoporphyrinogen oxidase
MLSCTRRELIAAFLGAPLASGCVRRGPTEFAGTFSGQNRELGHRLRDGVNLPSQRTRRVRTVIVGAGAAGLSAAWRLSRARQQDYEVLELETQAGGTSRSGGNSFTAYPWGAHYVPCPLPHARAVRALLCEMGVASARHGASDGHDGELEYDETQLVRAPHERVFVADRWYEGQYPHAGATRDDLRQLERFEAEVAKLSAFRDDAGRRAFAVPTAYGSDAPEILALDRSSFADWLSQRDLRSPRLRWWLEYGTRDDLGATLAQTSAFAGLHYHASRTTAEGSSRYLTWPEGNGRLIAHLARAAGARLRTGVAVARVHAAPAGGYALSTFEPRSGFSETLLADHVIFAIPQASIARLLADPPAQVSVAARALSDGAWLVANISLHRAPTSRGFPQCWDNVLYGSASVGYVVATHQSDLADRARSVWTWYLPLTGDSPVDDRRQLLALSFQDAAELVVADLARAHRDIAECIERIDAFRWGHAIVRPTPGLYAGELARARVQAQRPHAGLHFAHTELSGIALFEEAQWHGVRAAEEVLSSLGVHDERLS